MRINYLFITVFICLSLGTPAQAFATEIPDEFVKEKTFIEKYLPWLKISTKKEVMVDPTKTMQAPFSDDGDTPENNNSQIMNLYDKQNAKGKGKYTSLNISRISHSQIERWISEAVGTSFNFSLSDMSQFRGMLQPYYSDQGIAEFKKLLIDMNTVAIMKSNNKDLASYVTDTPTLKKQGVYNGVYTWLYDSYIIVSYIDNTATTKKAPAINRKYRIRLQLSQTPDSKRHSNGIKIDKITAKKLKIEEEGNS